MNKARRDTVLYVGLHCKCLTSEGGRNLHVNMAEEKAVAVFCLDVG